MEEISAQGYLRISQIIGQRAVSEAEATANRQRVHEGAEELKQLDQIKRDEPARFARDQKLQDRYRKLRGASLLPRRARPAIPPLIPISESGWWSGVKSGRYPQAVKLSSGVTAWRSADVLALVQPAAHSDAAAAA